MHIHRKQLIESNKFPEKTTKLLWSYIFSLTYKKDDVSLTNHGIKTIKDQHIMHKLAHELQIFTDESTIE